MTRREMWIAASGTLAGLLVASAVWSLEPPASSRAHADPSVHTTSSEDPEGLRAANAKLVDALAEADRTIAALREQSGPAPSATVDPAPGDDAGRGRRRGRGGEPTKEDWERMAQVGAVRVRVPCIRDTPWSPNARTLDRLGLAPNDAQTIRDAYAASNKRMADEIRPLCAKVLGSSEAAERVGTKACSDAILAGGKRTDPDGLQKSLVRVAELNAGNADAKTSADPSSAEQLLLAMTKESKTFEGDLASKMGPDEAKRLAWAPEMCSDRTTVRAKDDEPEAAAAGEGEAPPGRGTRGR